VASKAEAEDLRHRFTRRNFSAHDFQTTKGANEVMTNPIIVPEKLERADDQSPIAAIGQSFDVHEWSGSGPDYLHVHYADDEAWHVLEGTLTFRFRDKQVDAPAGTTIFVPAGVPHAYFEAHGPTRYLTILTPRLRDLISALHESPREQHNAVMRKFESEILE
jgi:mannose-6-phosphate isomerase-like protein (cupin superfamily)